MSITRSKTKSMKTLEEVQDSLTEITQKHDGEIADLKREFDNFKKNNEKDLELASLKADLASHKAENASQKVELASKKAEIASKEVELASKNAKIASQKMELGRLNNKFAEDGDGQNRTPPGSSLFYPDPTHCRYY
eukprot:CAMPEP_0116132100 /NCGR_PEP_ID=MMETSP0329-20121206/9369_1 /TAXON_ID=697910 /ORGANISM="Pseudo-nitzschia arenysensis, Strain B593" /LENGTH=135 /DNA_ID=CAMNT_0003626595 /DNA_START=36 /DNA_END=443 /DNA_ORIENTATION=-